MPLSGESGIDNPSAARGQGRRREVITLFNSSGTCITLAVADSVCVCVQCARVRACILMRGHVLGKSCRVFSSSSSAWPAETGRERDQEQVCLRTQNPRIILHQLSRGTAGGGKCGAGETRTEALLLCCHHSFM